MSEANTQGNVEAPNPDFSGTERFEYCRAETHREAMSKKIRYGQARAKAARKRWGGSKPGRTKKQPTSAVADKGEVKPTTGA